MDSESELKVEREATGSAENLRCATNYSCLSSSRQTSRFYLLSYGLGFVVVFCFVSFYSRRYSKETTG